MERKTWVFPADDQTRMVCHASAAVHVAYGAALRKIAMAHAQHQCSLRTGDLDGKPALLFCWESGCDERLPAIVEAIALLVGGSEVLQK
jgi:hypothetical protein